jgi:hypothetical protein
MAYYWTVNKGSCACCGGACPVQFFCVLASVTPTGSNPPYAGTIAMSTLNGITVPTKYLYWSFNFVHDQGAQGNWSGGPSSWTGMTPTQTGNIVNGVISGLSDVSFTMMYAYTNVRGILAIGCTLSQLSTMQSTFLANYTYYASQCGCTPI